MEGKVPPHNKDMEVAVLGAILLESDAFQKAAAILHAECFYFDKHAIVWNAMSDLDREGSPIDSLTVVQKIMKAGKLELVGGVLFVAQLTNTIASAGHIEPHAFVIKECYLKRKLIHISSIAMNKMYDETEDFFDGFNAMLTEAESINREINKMQEVTFADSVYDTITELKKASEDKTYKTGITTQLDDFDRQTMGFQSSDLIIVAARPAMGKTALIVDFMRHQASMGIPVGMFSLEMETKQLIQRMFASETGIPLKQIRRAGLTAIDWSIMDSATNKVHDYPLYICDKGSLSITDIVSIAKGWKLKHGIKILYIDYVQLISGTAKKNGNREQEVSDISRRLKLLAKDLKIPVVALSQLSRNCESRSDKRPMLSDLRESGALEQDPDMVVFPYRDEYYNDGAEKGVCELIIAKYRNGATGMVLCNFNTETQKFSNRQDDPFK